VNPWSGRVAVGTRVAPHPPHRSVHARLRIRLLTWVSIEPRNVYIAGAETVQKVEHNMQSLCTLRGRRCRRLTQHSLPGRLARASRAGLSPAGLHQLWLAPSQKRATSRPTACLASQGIWAGPETFGDWHNGATKRARCRYQSLVLYLIGAARIPGQPGNIGFVAFRKVAKSRRRTRSEGFVGATDGWRRHHGTQACGNSGC
jgi:hypothetical protein